MIKEGLILQTNDGTVLRAKRCNTFYSSPCEGCYFHEDGCNLFDSGIKEHCWDKKGNDYIFVLDNIKREKIYLTRYALTKGILKLEAEIKKSEFSDKYYAIIDNYNYACIGKDAFYTKKEAIVKAKDMKKKKILSIKKTINKNKRNQI